MSTLQAIIIAVLQGGTELFPVSSLGHAVLLPALLNWNIDQRSPEFLPFLVMLHLGTATALLVYFWRDWWSLFIGVLGATSPHQVTESRRVFLLIVIATIPAVIIGFLLEKFLRGLFGTPMVAALFLIVNGALLIGGEKLRGRGHRPLSTLTMMDALAIGLWQCTALIPGISRSGATIVGALLGGLLVVEITKKIIHEKSSSGDLFTYPLILAMMIGRIGCFTSGLTEETYQRAD